MASESQIRAVSSKTRSAKSNLRSNVSQTTSQVKSSNTSWKGEASMAFNEAYNSTKNKMEYLLNDFDKLSSKLDTLANDVHRAEAENIEKSKAKTKK